MDHGRPELVSLDPYQLVALVLLVAALLAYEAGVLSARRRGAWPAHRLAAWVGGLLACALAVLDLDIGRALTQAGPPLGPADFGEHVVDHLLAGMLAPLLLAWSAPTTLALRALPVTVARRLTRVLGSPPLTVLAHPVTAAVLTLGGVWVLYATELYGLMHARPGVAMVVHLHMIVAGYLLAAAIIGVDPVRHRPSLGLRALVLFAFMAGHSVLAKWLYAHPPVGVPAAESERGAMIMYYGGDLVDLAMIVILALRWYGCAAGAPRRLVRL